LSSKCRLLCQTQATEYTANTSREGKIEKLLDSLLVGQQNLQRDLTGLADRLESLERLATFSAEFRNADDARPLRDGHRCAAHDQQSLGSETRSKPSPGALLKRLKRGDLHQEEEDNGMGSSMTAAIARDGMLAALLGIRIADQRKGIEGSRLIHPSSPFFTGAPESLDVVD
jgi:hypothetical protein